MTPTSSPTAADLEAAASFVFTTEQGGRYAAFEDPSVLLKLIQKADDWTDFGLDDLKEVGLEALYVEQRKSKKTGNKWKCRKPFPRTRETEYEVYETAERIEKYSTVFTLEDLEDKAADAACEYEAWAERKYLRLYARLLESKKQYLVLISHKGRDLYLCCNETFTEFKALGVAFRLVLAVKLV